MSTVTNVFTTTYANNKSTTVVANATHEANRAAIAKTSKVSTEAWISKHREQTLLKAGDSAWAGKALLAEAMRHHFTHSSKKLTKTVLEKIPVMGTNQRRYEEDYCFDLEEKMRESLIRDEVRKIRAAHTGDEEELFEKIDAVERSVETPEVDPATVVAPMCPEIACALWNDVDVVMGIKSLFPAQVGKPASDAAEGAAAPISPISPNEVRARYEQAVQHFGQFNLWRVVPHKNKNKKESRKH